MPFLFRTRRPRGFNYKPIYYDAEREHLEAIRASARAAATGQPMPPEALKEHVRAAFRTARGRHLRTRSSQLVRTLLIAAGLVLLLLIYLRLG